MLCPKDLYPHCTLTDFGVTGLYWSLRNGACYLSFLISPLASRTANIQPLFLKGLCQPCCNHPVIFLSRMNKSMCICRDYHVKVASLRFAFASDASWRRPLRFIELQIFLRRYVEQRQCAV